MDLWIIQNGEKIGPIHDFEVRRQIERGDLLATTPAWHEGLSAWKALIEIDLFTREFARGGGAQESAAAPVSLEPPALPVPAFLLRRFWARWFDLSLFAGGWWIVLWACGCDIEATLMHPWVMLFHYVPWFVLESLLLHRFATTPGKWLLGIHVLNDNGSLLTLADSSRRAARVLIIGLGFGWSPLSLFCQLLAWFNAKRLGRPFWDHVGGHRVTVVPLDPLRLMAYVALFFTALQLQMIVVAPYVLDAASKTFPSLKEQFEQNPPWHLPKNSPRDGGQ